jgi:HD-GYP domain-containing protein (c-di-GMP phosphodiesterase class II)
MVLTQETPIGSDVQLRMSDLISALSLALDLTEGQPMGHAVKSCVLGMRIADILQLSIQTRSDLYYALLLKDAGCSSNAARMYEIFGGDERAAKKEVKTTDWSRVTFEGLEYLMRNVMPGRSRLDRVIAIAHIAIKRKEQSTELFQLRCERGGQIAKKIGLSDATTQAIYCLDEHWDGNGFPHQLRGPDIPLLSRIMNLCQTLEVFVAVCGTQDAFQVIQDRSGTWFDPQIVRASLELQNDAELWELLESDDVRAHVIEIEPLELFQYADDPKIDSVCEAFADVIDVKSSYTHTHSRSVTSVAVAIASSLGLKKGRNPHHSSRSSAARYWKTKRSKQYSRQKWKADRAGMGDSTPSSLLHAKDSGKNFGVQALGLYCEFAPRKIGRIRILSKSSSHSVTLVCASHHDG